MPADPERADASSDACATITRRADQPQNGSHVTKPETTLRPRVPLSQSPILQRYAEKTPGSARLHARAVGLFADGVTHVGRYLQPHAPFVTRAAGARKWDVDGNEYVDYVGGHGALLLGHSHPAVIEAVVAQLARGTHYGASHELELEWAECIRRLVPIGRTGPVHRLRHRGDSPGSTSGARRHR